MKLTMDGGYLKVEKEQGDPRFRKGGYAGGAGAESRLLYHVKQRLQELGLDVIKKRMAGDGHLGDDLQQYIRSRSRNSKGPHIYIYNSAWAVYDAGEKFNSDGVVYLAVGFDIFNPSTDRVAERDQRRQLVSLLNNVTEVQGD